MVLGADLVSINSHLEAYYLNIILKVIVSQVQKNQTDAGRKSSQCVLPVCQNFIKNSSFVMHAGVWNRVRALLLDRSDGQPQGRDVRLGGWK